MLHSFGFEEIDFFNVKLYLFKIEPDCFREVDFEQIAFYVEKIDFIKTEGM